MLNHWNITLPCHIEPLLISTLSYGTRNVSMQATKSQYIHLNCVNLLIKQVRSAYVTKTSFCVKTDGVSITSTNVTTTRTQTAPDVTVEPMNNFAVSM